MKKILSLTLVICLLFSFTFLTGCSGKEEKADTGSKNETKEEPKKDESKSEAKTEKKENKDITIAVVPKAIDNPIFLDTKMEAERLGEELGINVLWVGPQKSDAAEQVAVIEGLIAKQVDGIYISCNDAEALKDVINKAMEKGIKVATFDSDSPDSDRLFYAGTNNYLVGKMGAEYLADLLPEGGKVALLTGVLGAPNLEERIQGFRDGAEGTGLEILPIQTGEDDVAKSVEVVNQFTTANPDLAGWFFVGGWPYFADPEALTELKTFIDDGGKVVSIDTFHPMLKFVELDMVHQLIGSNYTAMGNVGITELMKAINGEEVSGEIIDTGYELCDKSNVKEVMESKTPW